MEQVGNEPFQLPDNLDDILPPPAETMWEYGNTPTEAEVLQALHKMKDSKGGTDNITTGCIRACGPWFQRLVAQAVIRLWTIDPSTWGCLYSRGGGRAPL